MNLVPIDSLKGNMLTGMLVVLTTTIDSHPRQATMVDSQATMIDSQATTIGSLTTTIDSQATTIDSQTTTIDSQATMIDSQASSSQQTIKESPATDSLPNDQATPTVMMYIPIGNTILLNLMIIAEEGGDRMIATVPSPQMKTITLLA